MSEEIVREPKFQIGDRVDFIPHGNLEEFTATVQHIQQLGWESVVGSQGYKTNIALTLTQPNGKRRDVWQSFCRPAKPLPPVPLSSEAYDDAIAAVEAMERVNEL